ncbi:MAG TPA: tetratricopeptide repeat protein [Candidatus Competibacter sp.]|nr:tetratricopeptide repeat protein [Candidatus Competibacter sp.]
MRPTKLQQLLQKAKSGDGDIQYEIAKRYLDGYGRRKNVKKGMYWLKKSAKEKFTKAIFRLGELYWCGSGKILENQEVALALFEEAAFAGLVKAQYLLGAIYATDPKRIDLIRSANWYTMASNNGDAEASYNLGLMYLNGDGVTKDINNGVVLIEKAADAGFELAIQFLSEYLST